MFNIEDLKELHPSMTTEDKDLFAYVNVGKKWTSMELECRNSSWFDYRFLHPFDATCLYIVAFNRVYREFYRSHIDYRASDAIRVLKPSDMWENFEKNKHAIIGCWHGRQVADSLGVPYDFYLRSAYEIRLKYWNQKFLPRPTALYGTMILEDMPRRWEEYQRTRMLFSEHPNYFTEAYIDTKAQNEHRDWLLKQAMLRSNPQVEVERLFGKGLLSINDCDRFDEKIAA